ncbi:hypothetical protein Q3G72_003146 [Acer saccharum]|nr:hypothetical protein Q3G72_003146 [Acer saccharum]
MDYFLGFLVTWLYGILMFITDCHLSQLFGIWEEFHLAVFLNSSLSVDQRECNIEAVLRKRA